jgi:AcrR family transcriptional regulator
VKTDVRSELLRAAVRLIGQKGPGAVSLQDIASEVGVSKQSLLYHFESKEALEVAVVDHLLDGANKSLTMLLGDLPSDESKRLDAILAHINGYLEAEPHAAAVFLRFLLDNEHAAIDRIRTGARPWFGFLEDALRRAQETGDIRKELDPEVAVVQIGMLVVTNFALLPLGWTDKPSPSWRKRRLAALVRSIGYILFDGRSPAGV